ncbi:hypothetical protein VE03_06870 [Pseudogymnoascus sp. 23342-1-I1]|nr:hypothetical protein VE03_06870 [Pseudogymnoascus sp. 23342-1-I1]
MRLAISLDGFAPIFTSTKAVGMSEDWNPGDDELPAFLRTLIARSDLALCIESLQLQGSGVQDMLQPALMRPQLRALEPRIFWPEIYGLGESEG